MFAMFGYSLAVCLPGLGLIIQNHFNYGPKKFQLHLVMKFGNQLHVHNEASITITSHAQD